MFYLHNLTTSANNVLSADLFQIMFMHAGYLEFAWFNLFYVKRFFN